MAKEWSRVTNVSAFLASKGTKRTGSHRFTGKTLHWPYCVQCRLILLKNEVTRRAAKAPCVWEDD